MRLRIFTVALFSFTLSAFADRQIINTGTYPGDGTGDGFRSTQVKANANFAELYDRSAASSNAFRAAINHVAFNVKDSAYGAIGDGSTDDTIAVRAAFSAATAGSEVIFPPGTYKLTNSVTVNKALRVTGKGATISLDSPGATGFVITSSGITIDGMKFTTGQSVDPPVAAIVGGANGNDNIRIQNCSFAKCRVYLYDALVTDLTVGNVGCWITGNTWTGNFAGTTVTDQCNMLDVRGYDGVFIQGNRMTVQNEEKFAHLSVDYNVLVQGNEFTSLGTAIGSVCIDLFADCKRALVVDNVWNIADGTYQSVIYAKNTSSMFSEHTDLEVSRNIITITSSSTDCVPIGIYGSWGLPDAVLRTSKASIRNNQVTMTAPNSQPSAIIVRGFNHARIEGNDVSRPERLNFTGGIDASNNENAIVANNHIEYGWISIGGATSNPPGTNYASVLSSVTVSGNRIGGFNNNGGIQFLSATNLSSAIITGNTITSDDPSNAYGLIWFQNCGNITNFICVGNSAPSYDCAEVTLVDTTMSNRLESGNSWNGFNTHYILQDEEDVLVDFSSSKSVWLVDLTETVALSATNCADGKSILLRLRAGESDRVITYDPSWVVGNGAPSTILANHTGFVRVTSCSTNCGEANIIAEAWNQNTDDSESIFRNIQANDLHVQGTTFFDEYTRIDNNTWHYGRNAANDANIAIIGVDSANQINIAPGLETTVINGPLKFGNTNLISGTIDVLVSGGGTNRLIFLNGSLRSNTSL